MPQPNGCNLKKRLFNSGRFNIFAFSKKKQRLDDSCDSGVEMNCSGTSTELGSCNASYSSQIQSRLGQTESDNKDSIGDRLSPDDSDPSESIEESSTTESSILLPFPRTSSSTSSVLPSHNENLSSFNTSSSHDNGSIFKETAKSIAQSSLSSHLPLAVTSVDSDLEANLGKEVQGSISALCKTKTSTADMKKLVNSILLAGIKSVYLLA